MQSRPDPCEHGDRVCPMEKLMVDAFGTDVPPGWTLKVPAPLCPGLSDVEGNRHGRRGEGTLVDDHKGAAGATRQRWAAQRPGRVARVDQPAGE